MINVKRYIPLLILPLLAACNNGNDRADAYGNFEATEIIISSEANGRLLKFDVMEGDELSAGQPVGLVDTTTLHLKKKQLQARIEALGTKTIDIPSQINVLLERRSILEREQRRVENLLEDGAATQKQLDDIVGQIDVINSELKASREKLRTNNRGLLSEITPIQYQIEEINDQINKAMLINPATGTVLTKFAEEHEIVGFGKPLYRISDISKMYLRAYISGKQLDDIRLGQKVTVRIDEDASDYKEYEGTISWVSDEAEFTPKIVQTREERVNLVYAIRVRVDNNGYIKIGMPGEVVF